MLLSLAVPCVVLMIGPSGSGKSSLAAWLADQYEGLAVLAYDDAQSDGGICTQSAVDQVHAELATRTSRKLGLLPDRASDSGVPRPIGVL